MKEEDINEIKELLKKDDSSNNWWLIFLLLLFGLPTKEEKQPINIYINGEEVKEVDKNV